MNDERKTRRPRGRPRGFDTDAALDQAVQVFWRRGYAGAGLAELTAAMGISPPSLYAAFGDKRGLFLAAIDRYAVTFGTRPLDALRAAEDSAKLQAFLTATVDLAFDGERGRGCLVACVAVDAAGDDETIRNRLDSMLRGYEAALATAEGHDTPSGGVLLSVMHAIAVRARAGATRSEITALAMDMAAQLHPSA